MRTAASACINIVRRGVPACAPVCLALALIRLPIFQRYKNAKPEFVVIGTLFSPGVQRTIGSRCRGLRTIKIDCGGYRFLGCEVIPDTIPAGRMVGAGRTNENFGQAQPPCCPAGDDDVAGRWNSIVEPQKPLSGSYRVVPGNPVRQRALVLVGNRWPEDRR